MAVFDASVLVDALVATGERGQSARSELRRQTVLQAPAILKAEATSALRRLVHIGALSATRATTAVEQVRTVATVEYPFEPFTGRVWELRTHVSVYDAWYVALAEWLDTDLVTADERLVRAVGLRCPVRSPEEA